jgi:Type I restriction modification DNA specificity domain
MWSTTVSFETLVQRGRWKAEYFCSPEKEAKTDDTFFTSLRSLVRERKETVDPGSLKTELINYVGLENIRSLTGELVNFSPCPVNTIKSRCKTFQGGDVLFARLRPNLNKVWLVRGELLEGFCSTEFLVLTAIQDKIRPAILRYLLSSRYIQQHTQRLLTGTALPRMSLNDLLDIRIPVPPMEKQIQLEQQLLEKFDTLVALRKKLETTPLEILEAFLKEVETSTLE